MSPSIEHLAADQFLLVVTTVGSPEEARHMARSLVEQQLVACAQINAIESFYHWEGAVQHDPEWRVVCKTQRHLYEQVQAAIQALHRYEIPAIHAVAVAAIETTYGDWVHSHCKPSV